MIETQVQKGNDVHLLAVDDDEGNVAQLSEQQNERGTNTNALLIEVWYKIKFGWGKVQIMYAATRDVQTLPCQRRSLQKAWSNTQTMQQRGCKNEAVKVG